MNTSLRVNEALLIAGRAFQPFQCVAWQPQDGTGELNLTVIDRTNNRVGQACIDSRTYRDPEQLADVLTRSREQIRSQGYSLDPWSMPE
ncbi:MULTISPECIES: hypothetical protein [Pseudomonas]|uniref:hypothetical protein n=1 Tax=Pseudomonas TaxID=286 RepID=UPI001C7E62E0|nr:MULTISPECIES: hypothetical protein [Pseudomonas]MDG9929527.1 hypothetical protein [Pseudomonas sp. GD04042]MDH0483595.1 hypothetical protein [Pseudomonas sp. GD04015]MDH0606549.1 hypothetical protein [Pseudomonas sp. GD03869]